jgi:subtilisin-like proprotein convertase family protein
MPWHGWSDTSFTSTPITLMTVSSSGFPIGYALVTVFTNGIPSQSQFVVSPAACPPVSFTNSTTITIPDSGMAAPYPSSIDVSGLGTVVKATVTINGLTHTFPDDLDFPLVGPAGQSAIIWSDAGGKYGVSNITVTLDDRAVNPLPDETVITSGTYRPANYGTGDTWPPPAPAPLGGSALSIFNGTDPNGTWSLYLVDDETQDLGQIVGGWTLTIMSVGSCPSPAPTATPTATALATATPTARATATATATFTPTPEPTATFTPTATATSTPTATATFTPTATATFTPTATATPTATSTPTSAPTATATPTSTPCRTPGAPMAQNATNVTFSSFTANWKSGGGGAPSGYRLDVSISNTFSTYVPGYQDLDVGSTTNYNVIGLSANTHYYYRLRAYNGICTSQNSNVIDTKTTPCTPNAPNAQPATNVTASSLTAHWSSVPDAIDYRLDVSTSNTFTTYVPGYHDLSVGNVTSYNVTGLSANTTYYYRVPANMAVLSASIPTSKM